MITGTFLISYMALRIMGGHKSIEEYLPLFLGGSILFDVLLYMGIAVEYFDKMN